MNKKDIVLIVTFITLLITISGLAYYLIFNNNTNPQITNQSTQPININIKIPTATMCVYPELPIEPKFINQLFSQTAIFQQQTDEQHIPFTSLAPIIHLQSPYFITISPSNIQMDQIQHFQWIPYSSNKAIQFKGEKNINQQQSNAFIINIDSNYLNTHHVKIHNITENTNQALINNTYLSIIPFITKTKAKPGIINPSTDLITDINKYYEIKLITFDSIEPDHFKIIWLKPHQDYQDQYPITDYAILILNNQPITAGHNSKFLGFSIDGQFYLRLLQINEPYSGNFCDVIIQIMKDKINYTMIDTSHAD